MQRSTHFISKSRISSVVSVFVTSNSCRILSSLCCFFLRESLPCSTLIKSHSFFNSTVSTEQSKLSDAWKIHFAKFSIKQTRIWEKEDKKARKLVQFVLLCALYTCFRWGGTEFWKGKFPEDNFLHYTPNGQVSFSNSFASPRNK